MTKIAKITLADQLHNEGLSGLTKYKRKVIGDHSLFRLGIYEGFNLLFVNLGGGLGYALRKAAAKYLFHSVGPGLTLGRGLVIRHPSQMSFGANVLIDDYSFLDASGSGNTGLQLKDGVKLSRNCILLA